MKRSLITPGTTVKHLRRFNHLVNVLVKYGFGEALTRVRVWEIATIERRLLRREHKYTKLTVAQRLRLALEEMGPTFIKFGQVLSTRPDLMPPEIIIELKKLQNAVHFVPIDEIKDIIQSELGRPVSEIFDSFDETPLAAASLAQVHCAVLDGQKVALKIQRPNIVEITGIDLDLVRTLAGLAERYSPTIYLINAVGMVEEFAQQIKKELDFRMEANNMLLFARLFERDKTLHVPGIYPELCTKRLITMEYLDAISISDTQKLVNEGYDLKLIARRGAILGFKATFQHGFFHADPHPGNILVMPGNVIGLVDFGLMATLSTRDRERLAKLIQFISMRDERRVARALNDLMESEEVIPAEDLEPAMAAIINEYSDLTAGEFRLGGMLFAMMRTIMTHGGRLRPQLLWVTKSIATQEDIARLLHADFNLMELGEPYAQEVLYEKLNPLRQPYELYNWLIDILDLAKEVPYDIGIILRELRKGKIKIEFEHVGLEPIRKTMEKVANRLLLSILIAALLISSSVIVLARVPPFVGAVPLLGFMGYIVAGVLSILLTISVLFRSH